ncbi:phosphate regulon sensor protein PhoR [Lachnospiraceae bacterium KM106-2]|nr:phosphate regulon sensor protein PhoR [Lachnospiraceae bacterium KM106-2]
MNQKVEEFIKRGDKIANLVLSSGYLYDQSSTEVLTEIKQIADIYRGRIVLINSQYKVIKDTYVKGSEGCMEGYYNISEDVIAAMKGSLSKNIQEDEQYVQIAYPIDSEILSTTQDSKMAKAEIQTPQPDDDSVVGVILMSMSVKDIYQNRLEAKQNIIIIIYVIGILVLFFAIWFSHIITKPFKQLTGTIDHMSQGDFDETLENKGFSEVESLTESFNKMIGRIQQLESSRQEFVSNVSHELKTPITSIKVLSESLLSQEDAPPELYREFLTDITDEIERENKIINDLLSLVKLDKTSGEMHITSISLNELLEQILKRLRPIAAKRNIELIFESFRPVIAEVDEVKLSLAISNLVENAIKYNFENGWVRVSLNADHKYFYIKVTDSGVGIPEELQEHIFERFYRVDKARSRETGGTGLGLSITRNAILMHRGAIKVYSKEKEGATFTVRVPLNYIA